MQLTKEFEMRIVKQFDSYCKRVLKNCLINILKRKNRLTKREETFDSLKQEELSQLHYYDKYDTDYTHIYYRDNDIKLENDIVAKAIDSLNTKEKAVILLFYFLGFTSKEIARIIDVGVYNVHNLKRHAIKNIKQYIEEHRDEEI